MTLTRVIEVAGNKVTVRELTVAEIREWLREIESLAKTDLVDLTLFSEFSVRDVMRMSDVSETLLETMTPREIRSVIEAAKEINADFFAMRGRIEVVGRRLLMIPPPQEDGALSAPSPRSLD